MQSKLTVTEAETLAVMLDSASRKMATVRAYDGYTGRADYAWDGPTAYRASAEMFAGFYEIAPMGVYI